MDFDTIVKVEELLRGIKCESYSLSICYDEDNVFHIQKKPKEKKRK